MTTTSMERLQVETLLGGDRGKTKFGGARSQRFNA